MMVTARGHRGAVAVLLACAIAASAVPSGAVTLIPRASGNGDDNGDGDGDADADLYCARAADVAVDARDRVHDVFAANMPPDVRQAVGSAGAGRPRLDAASRRALLEVAADALAEFSVTGSSADPEAARHASAALLDACPDTWAAVAINSGVVAYLRGDVEAAVGIFRSSRYVANGFSTTPFHNLEFATSVLEPNARYYPDASALQLLKLLDHLSETHVQVPVMEVVLAMLLGEDMGPFQNQHIPGATYKVPVKFRGMTTGRPRALGARADDPDEAKPGGDADADGDAPEVVTVGLTLTHDGAGRVRVDTSIDPPVSLKRLRADHTMELGLAELDWIGRRLCADPFLRPLTPAAAAEVGSDGGVAATSASAAGTGSAASSSGAWMRYSYLDSVRRALVGLNVAQLPVTFDRQGEFGPPALGRWYPSTWHKPAVFAPLAAVHLAGVATSLQGTMDNTPALTMSSMAMIGHVQLAVEEVLANGVPGDFLEAGTWRGGLGIMMRAVLRAHGDPPGRQVWLADSFRGVPPPADAGAFAEDRTHGWTPWEYGVPLDAVQDNFRRFGLLDDRVRFVEGFFNESLADSPVERLAVLRLDGDTYESTRDVLRALYDRVSDGGIIIIDDFHLNGARQAVHEFRKARGIRSPLLTVPEDYVTSCSKHGAYGDDGGDERGEGATEASPGSSFGGVYRDSVAGEEGKLFPPLWPGDLPRVRVPHVVWPGKSPQGAYWRKGWL